MLSAIFDAFGGPIAIHRVPDPAPSAHGAVIRVVATGLCRSDWHGWKGHDDSVRLPHVPGHELAGVVEAQGRQVIHNWVGERVTLPFVCGCGRCAQCACGNQQLCDYQTQPGFTHWGSFAQYVAVDHADLNLVRLPEELDFISSAALGCRFPTAFRTVVDQVRVAAGEWLVVIGCGGVGLSAIMIAQAVGARVVAVDIDDDKLTLARSLGAAATINASDVEQVADAVKDCTDGGAHVSIDALGHAATCYQAVSSLRKRGRHVQVGLLLGEDRDPPMPMASVIANELKIIGSHGIQAFRYAAMFELISARELQLGKLVGRTLSLTQGAAELPRMASFNGAGIAVIRM